jgi:cysteinyl-tRNA synthetase
LKNFITIREALLPPYNYSPRQLRLFFVTRAWNKEVNFDKKTMEEVFAMEKTLDTFFASVASVERAEDSQAIKQVRNARLDDCLFFEKKVAKVWTKDDAELNEKIMATSDTVHSAFCQNFDTRAAVVALVNLAKSVNLYIDSSPAKKSLLLVKAARVVTKTLRVLGLVPDGDQVGWTSSSNGSGGLFKTFRL